MQDIYKKIAALLALLIVSGLAIHVSGPTHLAEHSEFTCPASLLVASTVLIALAIVSISFDTSIPSRTSIRNGLLGIQTYIDATHTRGPPTLQMT